MRSAGFLSSFIHFQQLPVTITVCFVSFLCNQPRVIKTKGEAFGALTIHSRQAGTAPCSFSANNSLPDNTQHNVQLYHYLTGIKRAGKESIKCEEPCRIYDCTVEHYLNSIWPISIVSTLGPRPSQSYKFDILKCEMTTKPLKSVLRLILNCRVLFRVLSNLCVFSGAVSAWLTEPVDSVDRCITVIAPICTTI